MKIMKCKNCGARGKDCGDEVGILFECDGDYESPCFQKEKILED